VSDSKARGFTLPELTIGISVASILFLGFLVAISDYFVLITKNNASIDLTTSSQNLLRSTVDTLRVGDGVRQTNSISDPHAPLGGWNTSNSNFVIVIATPALNSSHNYIIDPDTGTPFINELVYYKSGSSLMKRTLANPAAIGNSLVTSCPPNLANSSCPADKDLADYFQSMSFTLYDQNSAVTSDPALARSIQISLSMKRVIFGSPISLDNSIRVSLRNSFNGGDTD
jgi:prepilin-type N-terminal cleavage/methylation domain-containing protein